MQKIRYLIIGAGFGGLGLAAKLKQQNEDEFLIWEKANDLGGCWRDNTYPGAACDVPSHLYSYSFAPKHNWSHRFAPQAEIHQYQQDFAEQYHLREHIRFNTEVASAHFDESLQKWIINDTQGNQICAQFLISATGQLNRPAYPNINGLDTFKGPLFHSATWQHNVDLKDKTVAVIGTGASAIQFIPEIAKQAKQVNVYQRSAPYVISKPDRAYSKLEQTIYKMCSPLLKLSRLKTYLTFESRFVAFTSMQWLMHFMKWQWRGFMHKHVSDTKKRKQLTPDYQMGCKRVLISNNFYPTMNQPHVAILDQGIKAINETGITDLNGEHVNADVIILGTGFTATQFLSPMTITGLNNVNLNQAWQDGAEAYLGMTLNQFPNLFIMYGPNTNLGHNSILYMLESQMQYILDATHTVISQNIAAINMKPSVQTAFNKTIQHKVNDSVWSEGCTSWYKTQSGKNTVNWPGFTFSYRKMSKQFSLNQYDVI
jgi:cation diffusion facilitator CzcD-associated flavoprotein CzcO